MELILIDYSAAFLCFCVTSEEGTTEASEELTRLFKPKDRCP